jgi:hypothetical protein
MRRRIHLLAPAIAVLIAACSTPNFHRAGLAPHLAPSADIVVVDRPPIDAVLLGTAVIQSSFYQSVDECEAAALLEAKKAGATHAVMRPARPGTTKDGPRCVAEAYYLADKR